MHEKYKKLSELIQHLPAPNENNTLANLDNGLLGTLQEFHNTTAESMRLADVFSK